MTNKEQHALFKQLQKLSKKADHPRRKNKQILSKDRTHFFADQGKGRGYHDRELGWQATPRWGHIYLCKGKDSLDYCIHFHPDDEGLMVPTHLSSGIGRRNYGSYRYHNQQATISNDISYCLQILSMLLDAPNLTIDDVLAKK